MLKPIGSESPGARGSGLHLPDPAIDGPYRPFTTDPGWSEAWWWLAGPVLVAVWLFLTWQIAPDWYSKWVIPEGYGILEFSQFVTMLVALFLAVRLLFRPFVRKRPFLFAGSIRAVEAICDRTSGSISVAASLMTASLKLDGIEWKSPMSRMACPDGPMKVMPQSAHISAK